MTRQRCSKHPFYYEPCSVCMEISKLEEQVEDRNAKTIELEESLHCIIVEKLDLEEELNDVKKVMSHAEESAKKYAEQTCVLQAELDQQNKELETVFEGSCELEKELNEALETIDQLSNIAHKHYNPEAKLKLSVNDMLMVRGIFTANTFLYNSLTSIDDCIAKKKDDTTREQLTLIKRDLELEWNRVADLLATFMKEFSQTNWNRMLREVQKIVDVSVETMNSRDLGFFMVTKEGEYISQEYKVRPKVAEAIETCIHSAGVNNLTAYSKEELIKAVVKICEEK